MIAGHFGLAAVVKAGAPQVPLWSLMLGTAWLDVVFVPLYAAGIETIEPAPGLDPGYGHAVIHADYTHSLLGALLLSALYGWFFLRRWGGRAALVLGSVAFSHWLLDLVVHRADMPLLPGNALGLPLMGLGLWHWPHATAAIELALVLGGAALYWRAARAAEAGPASAGTPRANLAAAVLLASGVLVLLLDVSGVVG